MKHTLLLALLLIFPVFTFAADQAKHVKADEAAKLIAAGQLTILDIRTADEFSEGHLKGAKNIDFLDGGFEAGVSKLDKTATYLIHCQSGGRSTRSLEVFQKLGFKNLIHLDGGYGGWVAAGQAVEK